MCLIDVDRKSNLKHFSLEQNALGTVSSALEII